MTRWMEWILALPARWPRVTLSVAAALTLVACAGAARMEVETALDALFPRHDPAAAA